ncbi:hypothetical protein SDRG_03630 [Saprolegnia diclina VS20]|uniref:Uncharacterized protein n=1 Tax=Saprolegnia diclina (strain VS20) TaxID=1156394 RepID=T0S9L0_SAPDV|nr:hypothetical protein SDRG_03630 [Saprolegnia diclina VS20]EQC39427.1 hypothetical protein SDRG_03630 [Saprolegnia diclina VS20]|eukprot:XP_008607488.1 hypothetical protein SDRG_03630 [Saprolegnia diclina VS20]
MGTPMRIKPPASAAHQSSSARRFRPSNNNQIDVTLHDVTTIHKCVMHVRAFRYDESIMVHPEYYIATDIVFACRQYPHVAFASHWGTWRSFEEFRSLDCQLRTIKVPSNADTATTTTASIPTRTWLWWLQTTSKPLPSADHPMNHILPPKTHRTRRWMFQHRTKAFMAKRQTELQAYLQDIVSTPLRLLHFLDVRAPPFLRYFSNFDVGFGSHLKVTVWNPSLATVEKGKLDVLEAHLLDDANRGILLCSTYGCQCHFRSLEQSLAGLVVVLAMKKLMAQPPELADDVERSAYMCLVTELYLPDDIEIEFASSSLLTHRASFVGATPAIAAAEKIRLYMTNFGLLHAEAIATQVRMSVIDVKKVFHRCKRRQYGRVGTIALKTLCSLFNITITLVTNDHKSTMITVTPWKSVPTLLTETRHLIWGYMVPTSLDVHGQYVVARPFHDVAVPTAKPLSLLDWRAIDEAMARSISHVIAANAISVIETDADQLQQAILDAVWDACDQNPKRFQSFQYTSKKYGTTSMPGTTFYTFLERLFRPVGAAYITDFLVHVLPLPAKRQALVQARWASFHTDLVVKRAAMLHRPSLDSSASTASTTPTDA